MKRIKKYLGGSYFRLPSLSSEFQTGASYVTNVPYINTLLQQYITNTGNFSAPIPTSSKVKDNTLKDTVSNIGSSIIGKASDAVSDKIFGDSELGRNLGTIFSSGLNSVGDTILNNAIKKAALTDGLTKNLGSSVGGAVAGLGANYLGRGITSILGNNAASRFLGLSASTVGGTIGGKILSSGTKNLFSGPGSINPIGLGMSAVGAGLSAAIGPSKEYNGTYGSTTKALDTVYDALLAGINFVPGWGLIASGAMALNKGLSNIFGSTDGMTTLDAILGSAFMPAPIKWLNMLGSSKTGTFNKLSWQNTLKTSNFMQNAFGDLEDKFSKAREEAGKTYGTFSQGAKKRALNNIDFSNFAWNKILNMADLNEYQNIRSSDMASINNLRYALWILGGFSPLARGKKGMKIFNNSTNHNLGLRLLSGAALIDNKQMILSALNGTKIKKKGIKSGINVDYYDPNNVMSVVANNPDKTIVLDELTIKPNARQRLGYYMKNAPAADIDKVMLGTLALGSAPIAALAAIPNVSTLGDYIAGTKLVNVGNKVITNPYVSSAIESAFAGHGLNHVINEGINGYEDAATTAMELTPLGRLAKPVYKTVNPYINFAYNKLPWTYRIPENPNMAYRRMGPLERDWIMKGNELSTRETNALTEAEEEVARAASKKGRRFSLFKAGSEHGGRKQFAKGQPWKGTTVTHGEEQVLAIPGKGLPWVSGRHYRGPQGNSFGVGDVSFEEAPFGSHIDLLTKKGYSGVNPSLLDGSVIYSPYKIFGRKFGYKKLYPKNATRTPQITAENASKITPKNAASVTPEKLYNFNIEPVNKNIFNMLGNKVQNSRYISKEDIEKYLSSKNNLFGVSPEQMLEEAKAYWTSPERKALNKKLLHEAKSKGYLTDENIGHPSKDGSLYAFWKNTEDPTIRMEHANFEWENIPKGEYDPSNNSIMLRTNRGFLDPYVVYHEGIHAYGATWPGRTLFSDFYKKIGTYPYKSVVNTGNFRQAKVDAIRNKPLNRLELNSNLGHRDLYNKDPDEFVAYGLTTGKRLGIKPFEEMPSVEKAEKLWQEATELEPYLKRNVRNDAPIEDRWALLNGTFLNYVVPITIGGSTAATLYNKSK